MISWLKDKIDGFINSMDPTMEVNLAVYGGGALLLGACLIVWTFAGPRDGELVAAYGVFAAAITGGLFKKGSSNGENKGGDA
jgi:hypothetical protein